MSVQRLGFLFLVTLAAAAAMPAFGQTVSPVEGSAEGAASIPDFSGVWVHPYFPGVEPPASGPGPVLNRSRRRDGVGNSSQFVGDYTNPILKPEAAEVVKRHGEISLSGLTCPKRKHGPDCGQAGFLSKTKSGASALTYDPLNGGREN